MTDQRITDALRAAAEVLTSTSDTAQLDAEVLLAHTLEKPRSHLFAWPEKLLSNDELQRYQSLVEERRGGRPIAYITGTREFWSLPLCVSADTLIPRPETELLVETAIDLIRENTATRVLDLGTGSGAIALAIASECPHVTVVATDESKAALRMAQKNAASLKLDNVTMFHANWLQKLSVEPFNLIISNPPYIIENDRHLSEGDVAFEPREALASGKDGLDDIRIICRSSPEHLTPNGTLLLEHGYDQAAAVRDILQTNGFIDVMSKYDLQGHERISLGTFRD